MTNRATKKEIEARVELHMNLRRLMMMPPPETLSDTLTWWFDLEKAAYATTVPKCWDTVEAWLGTTDLFYLLAVILKRPDVIHPWLYCRAPNARPQPHSHTNLRARNLQNTTTITLAIGVLHIL